MGTRRNVQSSAALLVLSAMIAMIAPDVASASPPSRPPTVTQLVTDFGSGSGSTVGPGGALFVTDGANGTVQRVDRETGALRTFASGLPPSIVGIGGAIDIAFVGRTAYVLVTLVGADVGGHDVVGIYRIDGPHDFTVVADIGAFAVAHPPDTAFNIPTGLQYALETHRGGFLVTDGHHNRVLRVSLDGEIAEQVAFDNVVPTGMAIKGRTVYMAEAGPVPHLPETGKIVSFSTRAPTVSDAASGAPLLVDVELGPGRRLFGLSQGLFPAGGADGSPALPNTGSLVKANRDGTFSVVVEAIDQPTSLEIVGNTAYVVTMGGAIVKIKGVSSTPY